MTNMAKLPRTARDVFLLGPREQFFYNARIALARATGRFRYPIEASGDLETMTEGDKVYWLHKTDAPIRRAEKGSGLEAHFERQRSFQWRLPDGFQTEAGAELSSVGDLMDHPFLPRSRETLYREVADTIFGVDVAMGNLECVILPGAEGSFTFRSDRGPPLYYRPGSFEVIKGFEGRTYDFVATACNHSLDFGEEGVASTMRTLGAEGIAFSGINGSQAEAHAATLIEKNGIRLGVVSHTFGLNAYRPPPDKPWIVNRTHLNGKIGEVDLRQLERQLQFCRER